LNTTPPSLRSRDDRVFASVWVDFVTQSVPAGSKPTGTFRRGSGIGSTILPVMPCPHDSVGRSSAMPKQFTATSILPIICRGGRGRRRRRG
jgi:hypothetical protein